MKNLLKQASKLIPIDTISYKAFTGKTVNDVGLNVLTYAAAVDKKANVQAVSRQNYTELGLDFNKKYVTIFVYEDFKDIDRDVSGDLFTYAGEEYKILSETDWINKDNWNYYMAVRQ